MPHRIVHCTNAIPWLELNRPVEGASFVTSLPDVSELARPLEEWKHWFRKAARLVLEACPRDGVSIFYQTDIIVDGAWIDKDRLIASVADELGIPQLWHRIVARKAPGTRLFGRPGFAHMSCFSRAVRPRPGIARVDLLREPGETTWARGMGVAACFEACRFVLDHTATRTVVDPFCGHGTTLAVANALGLDAIGIELARKRAQRARGLAVDAVGRLRTNAANEL